MEVQLKAITQKRAEHLMKQPEFLPEFNKQCEALDAKSINVPDAWDSDVIAALNCYSFSELQRMCQLLPNQYKELYEGVVNNVLILKLGATIVLSCKPSVYLGANYSEIVEQYSEVVEQCNKLFEDARQEALKVLDTRERLKI